MNATLGKVLLLQTHSAEQRHSHMTSLERFQLKAWAPREQSQSFLFLSILSKNAAQFSANPSKWGWSADCPLSPRYLFSISSNSNASTFISIDYAEDAEWYLKLKCTNESTSKRSLQLRNHGDNSTTVSCGELWLHSRRIFSGGRGRKQCSITTTEAES